MLKIIKAYKFFSSKRYSTLAGTLVYFLLMSIAPFILWLTIIFGNIQFESLLAIPIFNAISPFLTQIKSSAQGAVGGAGLIFLITTLYSSTNFFYHIRRSGEIIYNSARTKGGIKLRIISLLLIVMALILTAILTAIGLWGTKFLSQFFARSISNAIVIIILSLFALAVCLVLNIFMCPYKIKYSEVISGSLLTTILWIALSIGFSIYQIFATPEKLYGQIASLIVFLLWCYLMMNSFVIGAIYNAAFKYDKKHKEHL